LGNGFLFVDFRERHRDTQQGTFGYVLHASTGACGSIADASLVLGTAEQEP
jgi:hypothetical protein